MYMSCPLSILQNFHLLFFFDVLSREGRRKFYLVNVNIQFESFFLYISLVIIHSLLPRKKSKGNLYSKHADMILLFIYLPITSVHCMRDCKENILVKCLQFTLLYLSCPISFLRKTQSKLLFDPWWHAVFIPLLVTPVSFLGNVQMKPLLDPFYESYFHYYLCARCFLYIRLSRSIYLINFRTLCSFLYLSPLKSFLLNY